MSKIQIIPPDTDFVMNGFIFSYSISGTEFKLIKKGIYDKKIKPNFIAPSPQDVTKFFLEKGYTEDAAIKAWQYYDVNDWKDSKGNQVKNWKQKMMGVWFREENKIKEVKNTTKIEGFFQE